MPKQCCLCHKSVKIPKKIYFLNEGICGNVWQNLASQHFITSAKSNVYYSRKFRTARWHNLYQGAGPNFLQKNSKTTVSLLS